LSKVYTQLNFHKHTFCVWQEVSEEAIVGYEAHYSSRSGSRYIFTEAGVYRIANHWGRAANCRWRLEAIAGYKNQHLKIGYAKWTDFYSNDEHSKLFFITVDYDLAAAQFHHRDSAIPRNNSLLRTAGATSKRILLVKEVLTETDWAKYLQYALLEDLRRSIIDELLTTDATFIAIKQKHHLV
jgi:hypothetical protein